MDVYDYKQLLIFENLCWVRKEEDYLFLSVLSVHWGHTSNILSIQPSNRGKCIFYFKLIFFNKHGLNTMQDKKYILRKWMVEEE